MKWNIGRWDRKVFIKFYFYKKWIFVLYLLILCFIINYIRFFCFEGYDLLFWKSYFLLVNSLVLVWFLVVIWVILYCYFVYKLMWLNLKKKFYRGLIFFCFNISSIKNLLVYYIYKIICRWKYLRELIKISWKKYFRR